MSVDTLIVEDDEAAGQFLAKVLTELGAHPRCAGTVRAARIEIAAKTPDLVLLDLGLPDESGFELLEHVIDMTTRTLVVVLSGSQRLADVERTSRAGATFLLKPIGYDQTHAELEALVAIAEQRREEDL